MSELTEEDLARIDPVLEAKLVARGPRERILDMAAAASELGEPRRRFVVLELIRERYRSVVSAANAGEMPCSEAEVLTAAYGDAAGRAYWSAWLYPGKADASAIAGLVARHAARSAEELDRVRSAVAASLGAMPGATAREMVAHLAADPDVCRFVPMALRNVVAAAAAAPVSEPAPSADSPPGKRRTGSLPVERDRLIAAMRAAHAAGTIDILSPKTSNVFLEATFGGKRTSVCEARKRLMAEIAGVAGRQTPINGK